MTVLPDPTNPLIMRIFPYLLLLLLFSCGPVADFVAVPQEGTAPMEVQFENRSRRADTYSWQFGDGDTSLQATTEHKYLQSGRYRVRLTACKGKKTSVAEQEIYVHAPENCLVLIRTPYGDMLVELYDATPQHRDNFIKLAEEGFYDSLLFHRVIEGFMIQGGDPQSRHARPGQQLGMGGPGYKVPAEFRDTLFHVKGALAAARQGDVVNPEKASSGSQFYIVHGRKFTDEELNRIEAQTGVRFSPEQRSAYSTIGGAPFLDGNYTVFGRVIAGLEVIDKIAAQACDRNNRPKEDIWMIMEVIK